MSYDRPAVIAWRMIFVLAAICISALCVSYSVSDSPLLVGAIMAICAVVGSYVVALWFDDRVIVAVVVIGYLLILTVAGLYGHREPRLSMSSALTAWVFTFAGLALGFRKRRLAGKTVTVNA